jgi:hypothetical protein
LSKVELLASTSPTPAIAKSEGQQRTNQNMRARPRSRQRAPPRSRQRAPRNVSAAKERGEGGDEGEDGDGGSPDAFVPDPVVWKELGVSSMTGWRWTQDASLQFPPAIQIRGRNFRSRRELEAWKRRMMRLALAQRSHKHTP